MTSSSSTGGGGSGTNIQTFKDEETVNRLYPGGIRLVMKCTQSSCLHEFILVMPDTDAGIAEVTTNLEKYHTPWSPIYGFECPYCHCRYGVLQYLGKSLTKDEIEAFKAAGGQVKEIEMEGGGGERK
jgi:hypothetical protein